MTVNEDEIFVCKIPETNNDNIGNTYKRTHRQ